MQRNKKKKKKEMNVYSGINKIKNSYSQIKKVRGKSLTSEKKKMEKQRRGNE